MQNLSLSFALVVCCVSGALAQTPDPQAQALKLRLKGSGPPSSAPAPQKTETPKTPPQFELDQYQFAFLKKGSNWTPGSTPETQKIQEGHMANINRMAQLGKLLAAGPMGGSGDIRGIFVFKAASHEEAKALAAEDPAIKTGRLALEWLTWMAPKGIGVKLNDEFRKDPKVKMTMATHYLVLFKKGEKWTAQASPELQQLQLEHLWSIRQRLDEKKYAAAGPTGGSDTIVGLLVISATSMEEAKALAESDPMVRAGRLVVELLPWYVAKEVWP
jgi:uncharacterized protein